MENGNNYIIPMIDRAFEVINFMYNSIEEVGISQISKELKIPKATVYRILFTLSKWGFVEKSNSDKYFLGKSFIKYGSRVKSDIDISTIATPYIDSLAKEVGESVNLGILYEDLVMTIYNAKGEDFYLVSKLIPISPLNCSAMGKLYLSQYSDEELRKYFNSDKPQSRTINSIIDLEKFLELKENIKNEGVSYDREEYEYGLTCIAAPIKNCEENIVATISISGPTSRLGYKGFDYLRDKLLKTAIEIEKSWKVLY
ncbi:transcriptional regulator, IclR family [Tissierella praeacuta DSM 18095]|uniref:Transcriptional regulator, IclR family n=1 Tax=Tissierella praeacuta DSM 18095 TaxID=1123404 RepID=A0A1M4W690_9FIRM|nr:IclR family transcriptional regulator [Tissierella praeacuta]SHE76719.1 transcriptional regulator, IclR family [Tissierella praeacuta DSM 18095]SUP00039.1 YiaKLMNOPQRS operon repressor [Tissierella praeacuta]